MLKVTTLSNGLRIATQSILGGGESATSGIWLAAGSLFDAPSSHGVAHFLEHLILKGSKKFPFRDQLELRVEEMGAQLHAFTSREQTCFLARSHRKDVGSCIELLSDLTQNPTLKIEDINAERGTIIREMEEVSRQPEEVIYDNLHELAFPENPLGRQILGSQKSVSNISRSDLLSHHQKFYTPDRAVIVATGPISHENIVSTAKKCFNSTAVLSPNKNQIEYSSGIPKSSFRGGASSCVELPTILDTNPFKQKEKDPVYYCGIASKVPSKAPHFPWLVLQSLIGSSSETSGSNTTTTNNNNNTTLAKYLTSKGLCERVNAFFMPYSVGDGLFGIFFATKRSNVKRVCFEIKKEWTRLASIPTELEINQAKKIAKEQKLLGLDTTVAISEDIGHQIICNKEGKVLSTSELLQGFENVTKRQIQSISSENLTDNSPVFAAIGTEMQTAIDNGDIPQLSFFTTHWKSHKNTK